VVEAVFAYPRSADASSCRLQNWLAADDSSPSEHVAEQEETIRLLEALSQLPERQREALILQRYHGWKLREIAEHLNCTVNAVAGLHANALKKLRQLLEKE
jgi:RNA polymerase sigma-70 factor (ECF subfamily)